MASRGVTRLQRFEEKRLRTRIILAVVGSITLIILLAIFGLKLLIGFSMFLEGVQKNDDNQEKQTTILLPPSLDPLPQATSSGSITIRGSAQAKGKIVLYINGNEEKSTEMKADGSFEITSINLPEGKHELSAKVVDDNGNTSAPSLTIKIAIKKKAPILEVTKPEEGTTHSGGDNIYSVEGRTETDTEIRVNDRYVVVKPDNTFSYPYPLSEGENSLEIKAIDYAGNVTKITRKMTYQK